MTTLENAAAGLDRVITALDGAASQMNACGDTLDSVVATLEAIGAYGRAQQTAETASGVQDVGTAIATLRTEADGIRQRVLALRGTAPSGGSGGGSGTVNTPAPTRRLDPSTELGPLGAAFRPGVHEPAEPFLPKERQIADHLVATDGASVHKRPDDHTKHGVTNPDAIIRNDEADPGRLSEFKTLTSASPGAVKNNIIDAGKQVTHHGGGDVVIDGRDVKLDEATARKGHARAAGQARAHGQPMPHRIRVILGDGRIVDLGGQQT